MDQLTQYIDKDLVIAAVITCLGTSVILFVILKFLETIGKKSPEFQKVLEGIIFKSLKPVYPIILGAPLGMVVFPAMSQINNLLLTAILGAIVGSFSETAYHIVKRYLEHAALLKTNSIIPSEPRDAPTIPPAPPPSEDSQS